jgi:Uma2 family endonuclease
MIVKVTKPKIGPRDHGRRMSLKAFEFAQVEEGYFCELARGYIVVSEPANYYLLMQIVAINSLLWLYYAANPGRIHAITGGGDCKLLVPQWESERHPDISVYIAPPPKGPKDRTVWRRWVPEFVIEVVSESSRDRDYTQKRDEYWSLGVKEYWIVDAKLEQVVVLKRGRAHWTEKKLGPKDVCETKLLPGFKLPCQAVFEAAKESGD